MAEAVLPVHLDALLDRLQCIRHMPRHVTRLDGGLTNVNVRVTTADLDVVVRISSEDSTMLAIDREAEYRELQGRRRVRCIADGGRVPARRPPARRRLHRRP